MPVSWLKIDRAFISGTPGDRHDVAITRTILAMARNLGLATVAEGVEQADQLEMLHQEGCDYMQGFFVAGPMAPDKVPVYVGQKVL